LVVLDGDENGRPLSRDHKSPRALFAEGAKRYRTRQVGLHLWRSFFCATNGTKDWTPGPNQVVVGQGPNEWRDKFQTGENRMRTQQDISTANPAIVPVEGPVGGPQEGYLPAGRSKAGEAKAASGPSSGGPGKGYGANNEQLPERLQEALRRLVQQFSTESELSRRQEIRRIKQAHQFWRGLQYLWWDERDQNWHLPFEQKLTDASSIEDLPRYEFVTNIYQAFGLSLIAVLS
jgi:hypothetical protein